MGRIGWKSNDFSTDDEAPQLARPIRTVYAERRFTLGCFLTEFADRIAPWNTPAVKAEMFAAIRSLRWVNFVHRSAALVVFAVVFATHYRWILTHFSNEPYLLDSGWLAYLLKSADPLLHNPSAVNDLSFYAHHLSPHLFLFGAPLSAMGFSGVQILAFHQGFFFGLFFLSFYLMIAFPCMRRRDRTAAALAALILGALSNPLFQAAAYPHDEIAMISIASSAIAARVAGHGGLFVLCLIWLPFVREDGGFYVTVVCVSCLAIGWYDARAGSSRRQLTLLAAAGIVASGASFLIKAWFFPGFTAFTNNFSGQSWSHVTTPFVVERVTSLLHNVNIVPVLLGCALLALFDISYLAGLVVLSPIFLIHLLAVRPEHGHFTLYFALPWLLPCVVWLAVLVTRSRASQVRRAEVVIILVAAMALSAPLQAAVGERQQFWYVAEWAWERPIADIRGMEKFAQAVTGAAGVAHPKRCVSQGIAALIPDDVRPDEVLAADSDISRCNALVLMRGEMNYELLRTRAATQRFVRVGSKDNAELWVAHGR